MPEAASPSARVPAVVLYNGSGSRVDGLWSFWQDVARKHGVVLLGPTAFCAGRVADAGGLAGLHA